MILESLKIEKCSCGREFPLMEYVTTKNENIVPKIDVQIDFTVCPDTSF